MKDLFRYRIYPGHGQKFVAKDAKARLSVSLHVMASYLTERICKAMKNNSGNHEFEDLR